MATTNDTTRTTTSRAAADDAEGIAQTARSVADSVAAAAGDVTARLPEVAQTTREALTDANAMVHRGSDETLRVLGAASIGLAIGLLLGGANRLLVVLAMIPAALVGATLVERTDPGLLGTGTTKSSRA